MPDTYDYGADAKAALQATGDVSASFNTEHLYLDGDGIIRDSHIENLFDDLFRGEPLDEIFRGNFAQYYGFITGDKSPIPDGVFGNVIQMQAWVTPRFGGLTITDADPEALADPDLSHCTSRAVFSDSSRFPGLLPAYAPSRLNAGLLAVVCVYRDLAQKFNNERFKPAHGESTH